MEYSETYDCNLKLHIRPLSKINREACEYFERGINIFFNNPKEKERYSLEDQSLDILCYLSKSSGINITAVGEEKESLVKCVKKIGDMFENPKNYFPQHWINPMPNWWED